MRLTALLAGALLASPAAAANLITNGGFELVPATVGGYGHFGGGGSFDGGHWFVTGVDILQLDTAYAEGSGPAMTYHANSGRNSLDLTGTGNSSPLDGVYQDIATVIGQAYTLSFFTGRAHTTGSLSGYYQTDATVRVSIGDALPIAFTNSDMVTSGLAWKEFTQSFVATAATTRIAFANGTGNDYLGLDDVSVFAATPEPVSWAMMLIGFAAIGQQMRRRRAVAA